MRALALLSAAASLISLAWFARPWFVAGDARIAAHLVAQIADLPDAEAAALVTGISCDDERGLRGLVELAASSRHSIAHAAQTRLDDWLQALHRRASENAIDAAESGRLLLSVADELAARTDELGPGAAAWAAHLARALASFPELVPAQDRLAFFQRCDAVLMTGTGGVPQRRIAWDAAADRVAHRPGVDRAPIASVEERLLAYALRRGPLSSDPNATAQAAAAPQETAPEELDQPSSLATVESGERRDEVMRNAAPTALVASGPSAKWRTRTAEINGLPREGAPAETIDVPSPDAAQAREEELVHAPLADVIAVLVGEDRFEAAMAQAALRRRGMTPIDLDIATRLSGADAAARASLFDEVARRPGASLAAWLHYFAADEAADVRLRALGLMATSRDQAVVEDVYARAIRDEDPRIRDLAERLRE
jgi:hypothetical protein